MLLEAVWIGFAFSIGLPVESGEVLDHVAHLGVLLLLFSVGLKLNLQSLVKAEVIGSGLIHFGASVLLLAPALFWVMDIELYTAIMLAVALAFSSTVLAAKVLESKRELRAFHGRVAIGILVVQDLIALVVMSVASGTTPSPWALLIFLLPFTRPAGPVWLADCPGRGWLRL